MNRSLEPCLLTAHAAVTAEPVNTLSCAAADVWLTKPRDTGEVRYAGTISTVTASYSYKT